MVTSELKVQLCMWGNRRKTAQLIGGPHPTPFPLPRTGPTSPTPRPTRAPGQAPTPTPSPGPAHLEEIDLHTAIAEVQDDGTAGAKPGAQVGQPGQLVTFPGRDIGPCLQQVLAHVVPEILKEGDLVGESEVQS